MNQIISLISAMVFLSGCIGAPSEEVPEETTPYILSGLSNLKIGAVHYVLSPELPKPLNGKVIEETSNTYPTDVPVEIIVINKGNDTLKSVSSGVIDISFSPPVYSADFKDKDSIINRTIFNCLKYGFSRIDIIDIEISSGNVPKFRSNLTIIGEVLDRANIGDIEPGKSKLARVKIPSGVIRSIYAKVAWTEDLNEITIYK